MSFDRQIQLELKEEERVVVIGQAGPRMLKGERLRTLFCLPNRTQGVALVDTGAPLSVFPERVWKTEIDAIEWLTAPQGQDHPLWLRSVGGITGGRLSCRLGMIDLVCFDSALRSLPPRRLVAKFVLDNSAIKEPLIGLGGDALAGRRLVVEYSARSAWLHEVELPLA